MSSEVKQAARKAESSRTFRVAARSGFAANGFVHVLIGVLILVVAFGGDGETDQAGAFKAVAAAPAGFLALWVLAIALVALGVFHALEPTPQLLRVFAGLPPRHLQLAFHFVVATRGPLLWQDDLLGP